MISAAFHLLRTHTILGHGPILLGLNAIETIRNYIRHRSQREEQVLVALKALPPSQWMTSWDITINTYGLLPFTLQLGAQQNVLHTASKMLVEKQVNYMWPDLWQITNRKDKVLSSSG
jgi:hypothetical protein